VDVVTAYPGIFADKWALPRQPGERRTIVCAAALDDPRKRIDVLVSAFLKLARELDDLDLLLLGQGDISAVLNQVAAVNSRLTSRIRHRSASPSEIPRILSECSLGVLVAEHEAFGMSALEYLAAGIPAVVGNDGGAVEIVTAETGIAVTPGDSEACAQALRRGLEMASAPGSLAICRARAREFDWSVVGNVYEDLYREACLA
jgi:glycosyltransferase involved in cell wall biosynthesis